MMFYSDVKVTSEFSRWDLVRKLCDFNFHIQRILAGHTTSSKNVVITCFQRVLPAG